VADVVLDDDALDEGLDHLDLVGVETRQGLEVEAEVVAGVALGGVEDEHVSADPPGQGAQGPDGGSSGIPSQVANLTGSRGPQRYTNDGQGKVRPVRRAPDAVSVGRGGGTVVA